MIPTVALIATYDTKGLEADFIKEAIENRGVKCLSIDIGVGGKPHGSPDISLKEVCECAKIDVDLKTLPRGEAIEKASKALLIYISKLIDENAISCVAGMGGAGGTQIASHTMRQLKFGFPKFILTTLASGNTCWYLGASDIILFPSIVDVAGINRISRVSYERFASLLAESAEWYTGTANQINQLIYNPEKLLISQTMYGTTTKGVTRARNLLEESGFETVVFHASGAGGMAMENFIKDGVIKGVLDMTLAEIGAYIVGGLHTAGPHRLEAAAKMGIPQVIVPGAADTIVLPPLEKIPEKFKNRTLNIHNPTMTTMRTNIDENIKIANMIADKLMQAWGPIKLILPLKGLSSIDRPKAKFYYPEANQALFKTLKELLQGKIEIIEREQHIDDREFAFFVAEELIKLMKQYYNLK